MDKHLPRVISDDERAEFFRDGVVCLRGVFDEEWIGLLKAGLQKNLNAPGARSRIYDRTDDDHFFLYDSDNWQQIPEYEEFVYQSPCAQIAAELLNTESVHFFFEAVFIRSRGVTFPTPWHQDEPYWSVEGMDTRQYLEAAGSGGTTKRTRIRAGVSPMVEPISAGRSR